MKFFIVSLFPEMFENLFGLIQAARDKGKIKVDVLDLRQLGLGKHQKVDDQVYGGSDGMLLSPEVLQLALEKVKSNPDFESAKVVVLSPKGKTWTQEMAQNWSQDPTPRILICGRYAGFDQRFINKFCDEEVSIGDFILNGGEVAALAIIETVARLSPEVLGNSVSAQEDSFSALDRPLLEAPQFTRPNSWNNLDVPEILTSGHHELIDQWKRAASLTETYLKRPDLIWDEDRIELKNSLKNEVILKNINALYDFNDNEKLMNWLE